jgi:DNA-binding NarL/FixJ family response regulator
MQIFLVEDSIPVRERLVAMLQTLPDTEVVGHAADAESAIEGILSSQPDLVLLDISLASGSGFDVLRTMQAQAPGIEVYMLSSFAAYPYRQLAETLGARGFFDKTHEFERVRETIANRNQGEPQCRP